MAAQIAFSAGLSLVLCTGNGCLFGGGAASSAESRSTVGSEFAKSVGSDKRRLTLAELDQFTNGFADRYYMTMASAVDAIKRDNPDPVQQKEALNAIGGNL